MVELSERTARAFRARVAAMIGAAAVVSVCAPAEARQTTGAPPTLISAGEIDDTAPGLSQGLSQGAPLSAADRTAMTDPTDDAFNPAAPVENQPKSPTGEAVRDALGKGDLRDAYAAVAFEPIWATSGQAGAATWRRGAALLDASPTLAAHAAPGLSAKQEKRLRARLTEAAAKPLTPQEAAKLEIELTKAYLKMVQALHGGAIDPRSIAKDVDVDRPLLDFADALRRASTASDPVALLESFAPQTASYAQLRSMRRILMQNASSDAWGPRASVGQSLRPLDRGPEIATLRARLIALGDLAPDAPFSLDAETGQPLYDAPIERGVRSFQERHGLQVDGVAGSNTLAEMNVSAAERAQQIAVNMERERWLNRDLGRRHISVNIADFHVEIIEDGRPVFRSAVVVGQARKHQTPEFSDEMTHVVINPHWNVPYSIATKELLPILQGDPSEIFRRNMSVLTPGGGSVDPWTVDWWGLSTDFFPYRLRQRPGPSNALGDVKFIFPNHHAVYLHDTPAKSLFSKPVRAFSHGCIRVAKPVEMAEHLLGAQEADPLGFYQSVRAVPGETQVELRQSVPVHITYRTAWVDQDGALQLRRDVYGRDRKLAATLKAAGAPI